MSNTRAHFPNYNGSDGQKLADHLKEAASEVDNTHDPYAAFHRIRNAALPLLPESTQPILDDDEHPRVGMVLYVDAVEYATHKNQITETLENNVSNNLGSKQDDKVIIAQIAQAEETTKGIVKIDMIVGTDTGQVFEVPAIIRQRLTPKLQEIGLTDFSIDQADLGTILQKLESENTEYRSKTSSGLYLFV